MRGVLEMTYVAALRFRQVIPVLLLACFAIIAVGCDGGPQLVPVSGKVTIDGHPVGINPKAMWPARISFLPKESGEGSTLRPAIATINREDGTYELSTFKPGDGVMPGEYHVVITSMLSAPTMENQTAPRISEIPQHYGLPDQSGLSASIPPQRSSLTLDFELTR